MNKIYSCGLLMQFCKGLVKSKTSLRYIFVITVVIAGLFNATFSYGQYCLPAWSTPSCGGQHGDDFIDGFAMSNVNSTGIGCPVAYNYIDFSPTTCIEVCTGNNYPVTCTPGYYATGNDQSFAVCIDFNGNGDFSDPGEFFYIGNSFLGSSISGVITIPPGIGPINTRLRVICQTVFGPQLTQNNVCGNLSSYGEAIDYCLHINATPQVDLGGPVAQCGGNVYLDATNPGPGTTYAWSDTSTTQAIQASTSGVYEVTVTTSAGCQAISKPVTVYIKPVPVVDLGPDISQCGGTVTLDAGNNGTASYSWTGGSTEQTLTVNSTGTYTVTATNINSGCTASDTINVGIHGKPVINFGNTITQCGGNVTLDAANPGSTYLWSTGSTNRAISVTTTGLYSVTATTPDGCSASAQQDVNIYSKPDLGEDILVAVCPPVVVNLYNYYQGDGYPTYYGAANPAAVGPGVYVIIATNDNGCTDTALLTVSAKPKPNLGADITDSICPGSTFDLTAAYPNDEEGQYTSYTWNTPDPTAVPQGVYTLIVSNSSGCMDTAVANIINSQMPQVTLTLPHDLCLSSNPFLLSTGSPPGGTYFIDGQMNNFFQASIEGIGTHHVEYVYTNGFGCSDSAGADIIVHPQPFITVTIPAGLCTTSPPLKLDDYFTPPGGVYTGVGVSDNYFYPSLLPPGKDTIVDVYTDAYGCTDVSHVTINIIKAVHVSLYSSVQDFTICRGQNVTFTATGALQYQFYVDGKPQGFSSDNSFSTSTLSNHSEIMVVGSNQCSTDTSDVIIMDVLPTPTVSAGKDTTIILGQSIQLNGSATGNSLLVYQWLPSTGLNFPDVPNPTFSGSDSTLFVFKATDIYGCTDSSFVNVYVVIPDNVTLPNLITPNGDGKNDVWKLNPKINLDGSHLIIFNRWGQTVYEADNYANNWGGTYKTLTGAKLPDDTYYYVLKVPAQNNHVYEGPINVLSSSKK